MKTPLSAVSIPQYSPRYTSLCTWLMFSLLFFSGFFFLCLSFLFSSFFSPFLCFKELIEFILCFSFDFIWRGNDRSVGSFAESF